MLERIDRDRIIIAATEAKIGRLGGAPLRVDTGDSELDATLAGYARIVVGYNRLIVYPVAG